MGLNYLVSQFENRNFTENIMKNSAEQKIDKDSIFLNKLQKSRYIDQR